MYICNIVYILCTLWFNGCEGNPTKTAQSYTIHLL
nr:MAG TPA: hypothetical protein [Caudoviricetes sp.]